LPSTLRDDAPSAKWSSTSSPYGFSWRFGALAALFGAFLQAILELFEYGDLVTSAKLTDEAATELLTQYRKVSYWVAWRLWGLVPLYGPYRQFYREPMELIDKVIGCALDVSQTARAKTAVRKARNWAIIVFGALFILTGSVLDVINAYDSA
jgi:hypothetical protein